MPQLIGIGKIGGAARKAGVGFPGAGASDFLDGVIASTVFELDATIISSYGGSGQTWANLTASPADGETQSTYDFHLGLDGNVATDDPTFIGSAGNPAAHFSYDGGDSNQLIAANTSFLASLHKTSGTGSGPWAFAIAFRFEGTIVQAAFSVFSPAFTNGVEVLVDDSSFSVQVNVYRGSTFQPNPIGSGLTAGTDYIIVVSGDPTGTDDLRIWINTATKTVDTDMNPNTSTVDADETFTFASRANGLQNLSNTTRAYSFAMFNSYLDDSDIELIKTNWNARHERTYF